MRCRDRFCSSPKTQGKNSPLFSLSLQPPRLKKKKNSTPLSQLRRPAGLHQQRLLLQRRRDRRGGQVGVFVDNAFRDCEGGAGRLRARHGLQLVRPELRVLRGRRLRRAEFRQVSTRQYKTKQKRFFFFLFPFPIRIIPFFPHLVMPFFSNERYIHALFNPSFR